MKARNKGKRLNEYLSDYVVFDLETTGIRQKLDRIIEISGIKIINHEIVDTYSTLVNPKMHIPSAASAVNGITDEMVAGAPGSRTAIAGFMEFAGANVLVGHNIHTFDTNFLYDEALKYLDLEVQNDYIDTLFLARQCLPNLPHHRLTDVSEYFKIETAGAHRALNDCMMNQKCYEALGALWQKMSVTQRAAAEAICPQCGNMLLKRKGRYGEFWGCESFPRCRYTRNIH